MCVLRWEWGRGNRQVASKDDSAKTQTRTLQESFQFPAECGWGGGGGKAKTPVFTVASNREGDEDREQYTWQQTGGKLVTQTLLSSTRLLSVRRERV